MTTIKHNLYRATLCLWFAIIGSASTTYAQDQSLHYNGVDQYASFTAPASLPKGTEDRTIEFWMRAELKKDDTESHLILNLGEQFRAGTAFGVTLKMIDDTARLGFWGHNFDRNLGNILDEEWHFIAITYTAPNLTCYIDGTKSKAYDMVRSGPDKHLNTRVGTCYIGAQPDRNWFFNGAVDNLTIWNDVRTCEEIASDMVGFPVLTGNEQGYVAHFMFNEATGTTFKDLKKTITGTISANNLWTKPVGPSPKMCDEGIWFTIQNKSDVDSDFAIPARRLALKAMPKGTQLQLASIPLQGEYGEFLWKTVKHGTGFKLINKKYGDLLALDCSMGFPKLETNGNKTGQTWHFEHSNKTNFGVNAYWVSNDFISTAKDISYSGGKVVVTAKNLVDTKQTWLFQPMGLVAGFHISKTSNTDAPFAKKLELDYGYALSSTRSTSDWAVLNAYNIYDNMMNAFKTSTTPKAGTSRDMFVISKYDVMPCNYPRFWRDCGRTTAWRGYSGDLTVITEEMMSRNGTYWRGPVDNAYREFEQVVHEFGHTLNYSFFENYQIDSTTWAKNQGRNFKEWYPWTLQKWFNSEQSSGNGRRTNLAADVQTYIGQMFNVNNSWLPPRRLRLKGNVPRKYEVMVPMGANAWSYRLTPNVKIYSRCNRTNYMVLQTDGNLVVYRAKDKVAIWGSCQSFNIPFNQVKTVGYVNGQLLFLNAAGNSIKTIQMHPGNLIGTRFFVSDDATPATTVGAIKVVDTGDNVLWKSN